MDKVSALSNNLADLEDIERLNESIRAIQAEIFTRTLAKESLEQALSGNDEKGQNLESYSYSSTISEVAAATTHTSKLGADETTTSVSKKGGPIAQRSGWNTAQINMRNKRALLAYMANRTESIKSIVVDAAGKPVAEKKDQVYINIRCGAGPDYELRCKVPEHTTFAEVCNAAKVFFGIPTDATFLLQDEGGNYWSPGANLHAEIKILGFEPSFYLVHKKVPPRNGPDEEPSQQYIKHIAKLENYQTQNMEEVHSRGLSKRGRQETRSMIAVRILLRQLPRSIFILAIMILWAFSRETPSLTAGFHNTVVDLLANTRFGEQYEYTLDDATTLDLMFDFAKGPLVHTVFATTEMAAGEKNFGVIEGSIYVLGRVRVRQLRVARGTCSISQAAGIQDRLVTACYGRYVPDSITNPLGSTSKPSYFTTDPERRVRDGFWGSNLTKCNASTNPVSGAFNNFFDEKTLTRDSGLARSSPEVMGGPVVGSIADYDEMGFFDEIALDSEESFRAYIDELRSCQWVDLATRVVFFEMNFYNPNLDMFLVGHVRFEIDPTGLVVPGISFQGLKLSVFFGLAWWVEQAIFLLFVRQIFHWKKDMDAMAKLTGSSLLWWTNPWTILDITIVSIFMYVYFRRWIYFGLPPLVMNSRAILVNEDRKNDDRDPLLRDSYVYLGHYADTYNFTTMLDVMAMFLSIVKLLKFSKLLWSSRMLANTLSYAMTRIFTFSAIFIAMVWGYVILYYNLYGTRIQAFSTLMDTTRSILTSLVGNTVGEAHFAPLFKLPWDAELYHIGLWLWFTICMHFILVHIFLAVLIHAHDQVQRTDAKTLEEDKVKVKLKVAIEEWVFAVFGYRKKKQRRLMAESDSEDEDMADVS
eukprot:g3775.t1